MSDLICGTAVPISDVVAAIKSKCPSSSRLSEWSAKDIGTGQGFVSVMAKVALTWSPPDAALPESVIVKIPTNTKLDMLVKNESPDSTWSELTEEIKHEIDVMHNCEISVYEFFAKATKSPVPLGKVYGMKRLEAPGTSAFIVMEDLSGLAGTPSIFLLETLTEQQMIEFFGHFGSIQGYSVAHPDWTTQVQQMNIFTRMINNLKNNEKDRQKFLDALKTKDYLDICGAELCEKAAKLGLTEKELLSLETLHREFGLPDVLLHGDIHPQNIMNHLDAQGKVTGPIKAIIDWQCSHVGNPCEDLAHAVLFCSPADKRGDNAFIEKLLHSYYDSFTKAAAPAGPPSFSFEQLLSAFKKTCSVLFRIYIPMNPGFIAMMCSMDLPGMDKQKIRIAMIRDLKTMVEKVIEYEQET